MRHGPGRWASPAQRANAGLRAAIPVRTSLNCTLSLICLLVGRYQHVFEEEEETIIAWADGYDEDEDKDKEVAAVWSYCDDDESFQTVSKFLTWLREESSESESESEDEDEEDD
jgi:hypothetical protein